MQVVGGLRQASGGLLCVWRRLAAPQAVVLWRVGLPLLAGCWILLLPVMSSAASWQERRSRHFQVFYRDDAAFAASVVEWAEYYYTKITLDLGLSHVIKRDHVLWLWDKRCRIYLYPDRQAYLQATGAPRWSGGVARYRERLISSFMGAESFLDSTLPHELAHLLFREYIGFDNPHVPRWLDEGVAQYAEVSRRRSSLDIMRQWVRQDTYIPLAQLQHLPVNDVHGGVAQVFYTQAVTLVHFFLESYGSRRFIEFCSNLRDGSRIERALRFATAGSIRSLDELEDAWLRFVLQAS